MTWCFDRFRTWLHACFNPQRPLFEDRVKLVQRQMNRAGGMVVSATSNHEYGLPRLPFSKIDLSWFDDIEYHANGDTVTVGSAVTIHQLLSVLFKLNLTLAVVPDLGHLTMGGIVAGIGGGSKSFKNGYFHEIITEMDVLLKTGELLTLNHRDELFYAMANTLGTLGYILRMKIKVISLPAKLVTTENLRFSNWADFEAEMKARRNDDRTEFLDGTIFSPSEFVLVVGKYTKNSFLKLDNFVNGQIYWQSIRTDYTHTFKLMDYIYRWNTDLYYTTHSIPGRLGKFLRTTWWRKFVPQSALVCIKRLVASAMPKNTVQEIVQDVLIPTHRAGEFFEWFCKTTPVFPVYICPAKTTSSRFFFWKDSKVVDFGIGYGIDTPNAKEKTRQIEQKMLELGGKKLLYSRTQLSAENFWKIHDTENKYKALFERCNPYSYVQVTTHDKVSV